MESVIRAASHQGEPAQGPPDEVVQRISGRCHDAGGAGITEPALNTPAPCANAEPPQTVIARSVTSMAPSAAAAFASRQQPELGIFPARLEGRRWTSLSSTRTWSVVMLHAWRSPARASGLVGEQSAEGAPALCRSGGLWSGRSLPP